ncbi:DUF6356 family protein [Qipengyuania sphaerica]|uniref:DUF6356 family protein n=1 Tax=Qipengyuania sphaerica TaxID=2867243 RepID=UPI001C868EFC|nr:DUF6356 family protein [Qipengyuania sphaerica]MBX7539783.1 hypothetical protein [Qipengyuania sphaerica]
MKIFTDHPNSVGETYGEHFLVATGVGAKMVGAGLACFVHAVFPFWCKSTGSKTILGLHKRIIHGREKFDGKASKGHQKDWCI